MHSICTGNIYATLEYMHRGKTSCTFKTIQMFQAIDLDDPSSPQAVTLKMTVTQVGNSSQDLPLACRHRHMTSIQVGSCRGCGIWQTPASRVRLGSELSYCWRSVRSWAQPQLQLQVEQCRKLLQTATCPSGNPDSKAFFQVFNTAYTLSYNMYFESWYP